MKRQGVALRASFARVLEGELRAILALLVTALMTSAAYADPPQGSATTTVSRLLDAIQRRDQASYEEITPRGLVFMAAPDFGMTIHWNDAVQIFGHCSLQSLSEPKPLDGVPAAVVTATMTCPTPFPPGPLTFDFIADDQQVLGIYPGGMDRSPPDGRQGDDAHH